MADNFAILRFGKYKAQEVRQIYGEAMRDYKKAKMNMSKIDKERSKDNLYIGETKLKNVLKYIKDYREKHNIKGRFNIDTKSVKNSTNVMCDFLITCSPELQKQMTEQEMKDYYNKIINGFLLKKFPEIKPVAIAIHRDEGQEGQHHCHFLYLPLCRNKKGVLGFNTNALMPGKGFPRKLQDDFYSFVSEAFPQYNFKRGDKGGKKKHLTVKEYRELNEELEKLNEQIEKKKKELTDLTVEDLTPNYDVNEVII